MKRPLTTTLLAVLCLSAEAADPGPLTLTPQPVDPDRPWTLSWESSPGTLYQIEHATNLAQPGPWRFEDAVVASSRASKINVPGRTSAGGAEFWRVSLTPRLLDLQPAFLDPADPGATLELFGQGLPTNATVRLNGQPVPSSPSPNPDAWRLIRAADLPPGLTDIRSVTVLTGTNVVATLHLYLPITLGAVPPAELLQGPAPEPPASPRAGGGSINTRQKRWLTSNARSSPSLASLDHACRVDEDFLDSDSDDDGLPETAAQKKWLPANFRLRLASGVKPPPDRDDSRDQDCDGRERVAPAGTTASKQKVWHTIRDVYSSHSRVSGDCDDREDGVFAATGELRLQQADLVVPGRGPGFAWIRTYRSRTGPDTAQGAGWDFSYNVSLSPQSDGTLVLRPGNGRADTFYPTATNTWIRDEYFCEVRDLNADGMPDVVFADTGRWMFHPAGGPAAGRLHQIIDRHGNTATLEYDAAGLLTAIVDDLGRTHQITYDPAGRIVRVRDASGRTVHYEYDGDGNLAAVISPAVTGTPTRNDFPGGLTNRFAYTKGFADSRLNHNLTRWTDPMDQAWLSVAYHPDADPASLNFDTVTRLTQGTNTMDWSRAPGSGAKTVRVWIRDALGNVSRATYDSRRRVQENVDYTGRAPDLNAPVTETSNQPVNKLRPDDPEFFTTRWTWNRDSLCTLAIAPDGSRTQFLHEGDLNPAAGARQRGNLRVVRQAAGEAGGGDLDGDGAPDYTERSWRFDYDPRFGSPASLAGFPPLSSHLRSAGIIHRDLAARNVLLGARAGGGFVTAETDPRGNVHTAAYDARGNRIELRSAVQAFAHPPALHFAYNAHGQLTAVTNAPDAAGRRRIDLLQYQTDGPAAGCLRSVTRNAGDAGLASTVQLECDERGNVTRLVDPRGADTLATYNALDQCVRTQSPTLLSARSVTDFLYDANGNLVETRTDLRDANDVLQHPVRTLAQYDALDRLIALSRQTAPGTFLTERVAYDPNGNLVAALSPLAASGEEPDNQVRFEYDERGLLFRVIAAPGSPLALTNSFSYSRTGRGSRLSVRSPTGKSDAYVCERDGFGQVIRITDPMGNVTTLARDRAGQITRLTTLGELLDAEGDAGNVRLSETGWHYDALGRCTAEQAAFFQPATQQPLSDGARTTTLAYAPNGALVQVTDDRGAVTRLAHDAAGRLASLTDAKTNVLSFSYNPADELVLVQSEERSDLAPATTSFSVALVRDAWGRVTRRTDNVGNTRTWAYDSLGRCVQSTDAAGTATWAAYDDLGRRTLSIGDLDGDGVPELATDITRSWTYDANSRCVTATDPNTNTTRLTYDARNRLVATRHPDGTETALIWSPRSNLLRVQDPNGTVVSNFHDRLDRCVGRDITPGPGVASQTTFERFAYDGLSRLVGATNNGSQLAFTHDSLGHGTATTRDGLVSTATYDALGNPVSLTSPSGLTAVFTHDALGQPVTLGAAPAGQAPRPLVSWAYEGPGRPGRISRTNGINTRLNWNGGAGTPNTPGDLGWRQVSRVNHQRATGGTVIDQRVATFDSRQNRIRRAQTHPFSAAAGAVTNDFAYDPQQRLVQAVNRTAAGPVSATTYTLGPAGHRLQVLANGTPQPYAMDPTPRPGPADFQAGQYTLTPFGAQAWDDNGNLVSRTSSDGTQTAFSYDYANRLVAVLDLSSGAPVPVATYDYDALGRRIRRTTAGPSPVSPPEVTDYVLMPGGDCDDGNPRELRLNGNPDRVYLWGGADLAVRLTPTGQPEFFHTDDLGNVLALTDVSGNVLERCDYDPFGAPTFLSRDGLPLATNAAPSGNPFLAGGQLRDPETGFYRKGYDYWMAQTQLADSAALGIWASKKGYDYWMAQSSLSTAAARARTKVVDPFQDVAGTGVLGRALVFWASKKGYDYYMGQGTHHAADAHTNPTFQENQLSGQMPDLPDRHFRTTRLQDNPAFSSPMNAGNMPEMPHRRLNPSNPLHDGSLPVSNPLFDPHAAQSVNRSYRFFQNLSVMDVSPSR